jgi:signal transduction histidine kinase
VASLVRGALPASVFVGTFLVAVVRSSTPHIQQSLGLVSVRLYLVTLAVAVACAWAVLLTPTRRWPLFIVAFLVHLTLLMWPALFAASYVAATTYVRRTRLALYAGTASVVVLLPEVIDMALGVAGASWARVLGSSGGVALFVGLPMVIGLWISARRQVLAGLRERAEQLERSQASRAEQARVQERARIAREMHDVVAHRVSLMVLHAGALEVNTQDEALAAEAALIRTTGREALTQLRDVLGVLRSPRSDPDSRVEPQPLLRHLDRLLQESRSAGIRARRRDEGQACPVPAMVEHTAYRIIQEALTNVHKHAGPVAAQVVLRYLPAALEVTVHNAAPSRPTDPAPGSGLGLLGLRERVELLDGELTTRRWPDGSFTVSARLPLHAPQAEEAR